jgi:hypothetical protein
MKLIAGLISRFGFRLHRHDSETGIRTSEIFIENGGFHGQLIAADLKAKLKPESVSA